MNIPVTTHPFRRTTIVSLVALVATLMAAVIPTFAKAEEEFVSGSGKARADIVRVGPSAARLSLAPAVGVSLSDHLGTAGRGQTQVFDYGALDTTINSSARDLKIQFPELRVESTDPNAEAGVRWEPKPGIIEDAAATKAPVGRSSFRLAELDVPGLITITGGQARTFSGVYKRTVDGKAQLIRAAGGTVDIDRVTLAGGVVVLRGLHWEAAQVTDRNDDEEPESIGRFSIAKATYPDGVFEDLSSQNEQGKQLFDAFDQINAGLAPTGLQIGVPKLEMTAGVVRLSPLAVRIVDSQLLAPVFGSQLGDEFQKNVRGPLSEGFLEACRGEEGEGGEGDEGETTGGGGGTPGNVLGRAVLASHGGQHEEFEEFDATGPNGQSETPNPNPPTGSSGDDCGVPFLVLDVILGVFSGAGRLELELGGVRGTTEGQIFDDFNLQFGGFDVGGGDNGGFVIADTDDVPEAPPVVAGRQVTNPAPPAPTTDFAPSAPPSGGGTQVAAPQTLQLTGSRASAAWAVGLVGLGAALFMAGTDYRRLRTRRRAITPIS